MKCLLLFLTVSIFAPAILAADVQPGVYKFTCISNFDKKKNGLTMEYFLSVKPETSGLKFAFAEGKEITVTAKQSPKYKKTISLSIPNKGNGEYNTIMYQPSDTDGFLSLFVESKTKHLEDDHHHSDGEDEVVGSHKEEPAEQHTYTKTIIGKNHLASMLKGVYAPADTLAFISKDGKVAVQGRGYCSAAIVK